MTDESKAELAVGSGATPASAELDTVHGVKNDEVDWFLRETTIPLPTSNTDGASPNGATKTSPKRAPGLVAESFGAPLQTTVSNSNDHVASKTKPSIATIEEEPVIAHPRAMSTSGLRGRSNSLSIGRTNSVSSTGSAVSAGKESGGFFSRLKEKFHKSPPGSPILDPIESHAKTPKSPAAAAGSLHRASGSISSAEPLFKDNYALKSSNGKDTRLSRTLSNPNPISTTDSDPKLKEYVKFFAQPHSKPGSRKNSVSDGCLANPLQQTEESVGNKLTSFLKRKSNSGQLPLVSMATEFNRRSSDSHSPAASQVSSATSDPPPDLLPEFQHLKPLKRVAFHSSTFLLDPPQQIPAKSPRKGNVEVLPNGQLRIYPLTAEDKKSIEKSLRGQGGGIIVGGTGSLHFLPKKDDTAQESEEDKEKATEQEAKDFEEHSSFSLHGKNISIDKPMVPSRQRVNYTAAVEKMALDVMYTRCCHLREILPIPAILKQIPKNSLAPLTVLQLKNPTPTMIEVETFADFIRIAPIICISLDGVSLTVEQFRILLSAMSAKKQLEKLSLRNVPMDAEGWCLLCWFLSRNTVLQRLDITQCPSLTINNLKKKTKKDNGKPGKRDENLVRMVCNKDNRSDMDWSLFIATLIARGGIDELILTGCCITDISLFEKLFKFALSIKTYRLGLAYNRIGSREQKIILDYWLFKPFVRGLDLGFNDFAMGTILDACIEVIGDKLRAPLIAQSQLGFLSLNSTNLRFSPKLQKVFDEFLIKFPHLKYLDLSNNPRLFGVTPEHVTQGEKPSVKDEESPELSTVSETSDTVARKTSSSSSSVRAKTTENEIMAYFTSIFPLFPSLVRLHLENNYLSSESLISFANIMPFCKNLGYVSLLGNVMEPATAAALLQAVKNCPSLITLEGDFDSLPSWFKDRLGVYTMRNMESTLYTKDKGQAQTNTLTSQLNTILELKAKGELDLKGKLVQDFVKEASEIKAQLHDAINELNKLQLQKQLSMEGKETLFRLMFIDSSITKGLQLIDSSLMIEKDYPLDKLTEDDKEMDEALTEGNYHDRQEEISYLTPPPMSRNSSRSSLNQLDKEEGSMHRLNKSWHDDHDEGHEHFLDLNHLSGDEIRRKIASVDLNQLIDISKFISDLKKNGVPIASIFESFRRRNEKGFDISIIKERLKSFTSGNTEDLSSGNNSQEELDLDTKLSSKDPSSVPADKEKSDNISDIYDEVLGTIVAKKES